ncbi:MAG: 50S ribosomal protein L6 [Christensenellales bacterium]|jgi:large subunit ribosomal protein L6
MSRIGKLPVVLPAGVTVTVDENNKVTVKGPKGTLEQQVSPDIAFKQEEGTLYVTCSNAETDRNANARYGLYRVLVNNMVIGVSAGFTKTLTIVGTGYRAQVQGRKLVLNIGFSHPVEFDPPQGIEFETPAVNTIIIKGIDKQMVGEIAANVRKVRPPEPYLGKGIRYADEIVRRKAGKAAK